MSQLLRDTGEALYGPRWQTELSRDLAVSDRTVRRWSAGVDDMPPIYHAGLLRLALARAGTLHSLVDRLRRAASPVGP